MREEDVTPVELYQIFRRRSRIFYGIVAASLTMAIIVCIVSTRRYEATGTIQIGKESSDALGLDSLMGGMGGGDAGDALQANINIETQAHILQSDTLALFFVFISIRPLWWTL
jgi:uncharacterized protein involved in exopolysaccharide biosynthesis